MEFLKQPKSMCMEGDLGANWKKFKNNYELYAMATGCKEKSKEVQSAVLLHCLGEEAYEVLETLDLSDSDRKDPVKIIDKLDSYFLPKTNVSVETHKFNMRMQLPGELFDNYLSDLKRLASNCDFGIFKDRMLKDRIVSGIRDPRVKDRLLREVDLDLTKTIDIVRAAEQTEQHLRDIMDKTKDLEINAVKGRTYKASNSRSVHGYREYDLKHNKSRMLEHHQQESNDKQRSRYVADSRHCRKENQERNIRFQNQGKEFNCSRCGRRHFNNSCPAFGKKCNKCLKLGHFAGMCKSKIGHNVNVALDNTDFNSNNT